MARLLFIDIQAVMLDYAMRCMADGHRVRWFFPRTEKTKNIGRGLVERIDDWREFMRWSDLVILADNTRYLREIDSWRKNEGIRVIGATQEAADWEINRTLGQKVLKKAGVATLPYKEFKNYDDAISCVKREMRRFVSKPCGDVEDKGLSYVAKSPEDMIYMLERWKRAGKHKDPFILQEFVEGCEMAVGGWFGPGGFNEGWLENWEFKALMAGERGPNTGEMGTVMRYVKRSKLADKVLKPIEDELDRVGYVGYVDVNCIIDEEGNAWPLEFTTRMGWPTFNIQQRLHQGDHASWLGDLCDGRDSRHLLLKKLACGVVMALPDFPYSHITRKDVTGVPVYGMDKNPEAIHPCEMMKGTAPKEEDGKIVERPSMVTAGDYVLVTTGTGESVKEARSKAYRVMESLKAPSSPFWRPDIGQRLKDQLPAIQSKGYATEMEF